MSRICQVSRRRPTAEVPTLSTGRFSLETCRQDQERSQLAGQMPQDPFWTGEKGTEGREGLRWAAARPHLILLPAGAIGHWIRDSRKAGCRSGIHPKPGGTPGAVREWGRHRRRRRIERGCREQPPGAGSFSITAPCGALLSSLRDDSQGGHRSRYEPGELGSVLHELRWLDASMDQKFKSTRNRWYSP